MCDLFIALTCKRRPKFVKAFEVVCFQDLSRWLCYFLQNVQIALVWSNQVAAIRGGYLQCKSKCATNMVIHLNPAVGRCTGAAAFCAILNIDFAVERGFTAQPWQVSQDGLAQTHPRGSRQLNYRCCSHLTTATKHLDDLLYLFAVLALRRRLT